MRYLFVVTGIGYGHSTRDLAIINEIKKRDKKAKFLIAGYFCSYNFFKEKKFDVIRIEGEDFSGDDFKLKVFRVVRKNWDLPVKWTKDILRLVSVIKEFRPDFVVVDWEPVGVIASALTKTKSIMIFNYDPDTFRKFTRRFNLSKSKAIQHQVVSRIYSLSSKYSKAIFIPSLKIGVRGNFHYIDFMIRKKPKDLPDKKALLKKLKLSREPILVMLGGTSYGYSLVRKMIKFFYLYDEDFLIFAYNKTFVDKNIRSLGFKDNYLEYLKVSKAVITLAGHSSFEECAIFKKPCLVFPIINHVEQTLNALEIEKVGFARVSYLNDLDEERISRDIKHFIRDINKLSKRVHKFNIKGEGAVQVANFLLNFKNK